MSPCVSVLVEVLRFESVDANSTIASGTGLPCASVTLPRTTLCASAGAANAQTTTRATTPRSTLIRMETLQRIKTVSISLLEETLDCSEVRDDRSRRQRR